MWIPFINIHISIGGIILLFVVMLVILYIDKLSYYRLSALIGTIGIWLLIPALISAVFDSSYSSHFVEIDYAYMFLPAVPIYFILATIFGKIFVGFFTYSLKRVLFAFKDSSKVKNTPLFFYNHKKEIRFKYVTILTLPGFIYAIAATLTILSLNFNILHLLERTFNWNNATAIALLIVGLIMIIVGIRGKIVSNKKDEKRQEDELNENKAYWNRVLSKKIPLKDIMPRLEQYVEEASDHKRRPTEYVGGSERYRNRPSPPKPSWIYRDILTHLRELRRAYPNNTRIPSMIRSYENAAPLSDVEKDAIRREYLYGSADGGIKAIDDYKSTRAATSGNSSTSSSSSSSGSQYSTTQSPSPSGNSSTIIRDTSGNMTSRVDGNILRDVYGNQTGRIDGNIIRDAYGNHTATIEGKIMRDTHGNHIATIDGKVVRDTNGNHIYTLG